MSPRAHCRRWRASAAEATRIAVALLALAVPALAGQEAADTAAQAADTAADTARAPEPVPAGQASEDEAIRSRLQAVFDRVPSLSGVTVAVDAGVVRLTGRVGEGSAVDQAVELARAQEGIVFVDEEIAEDTSLGRRLASTWATLREEAIGLVASLPLFLAALLIVLAFTVLASLLGRWRPLRFFPERNALLQNALRHLLQVAAVLAGILIALELLDATALVGAVVGTAGIAGLAIGFAFKDIAENYLAGLLLGFRHPFAQNDHVRLAGYEGKIVRLTARETILMTLDGNHVQVPNAVVFREGVTNFSRNPKRRFTFLVDVDPETELGPALDRGLETLRAMEGVLDAPAPNAAVEELGASTIALRFFGWVDQRSADFLRVRSEAIRLVKNAFDEAGIAMPSPEYRVRMSAGEEPEEGPEAPAPAVARPTPDEADQRDVSVDRTIDEQIEEDRRGADEPDLLEDTPASEAESEAPREPDRG